MTSLISHTSVDCSDAFALSEWWKQVLGYVDIDGDPNEPGHEECMIRSAQTGHQQVKNRLHFDLRPADGTRDEEVARLLSIGATQVDDQREVRGDGTGWMVLADPEGNEFCVLRSDAERGVAGTS